MNICNLLYSKWNDRIEFVPNISDQKDKLQIKDKSRQ